MNILITDTYKEIKADDSKFIKDIVENDICRSIILSASISDDEIKSRFIEVDADTFIIKQGRFYTKLQIRRACRELGIQDKLNTLISSNEIFSADWSDAQDIDLEDEVFLYALQQGDFTEFEIQKIKETISHG